MKKANSILFLITLASLSAFGPFVTDMYLPSLPSLPEAFSTSLFLAQMSMSVCMFGLALGQLIIGPLSDKFGRRTPLMFSMWLFFISTLGCVFSTDIYFFVIMRFFQGIAGAGGIVLSRSISSDHYSGLELAKFLGVIAAVHSIAPAAAPVIGGITLLFTNWRGIFVCLFCLSVVLLLLSRGIRESLLPERRSTLSVPSLFKLYKHVFKDKVAILYIFQQAAMAAILFTYISASPFIFENIYALTPLEFSGIFAFNALGIGIGSAFASRFRRQGLAVLIGSFAALVFAASASFFLYFGFSVYLVEMAIFCMMSMFGLTAPAAATIVLDCQRNNAGTAAALLGASPFFVGSLAAPIVGFGDITFIFSVLVLSGAFSACILSLAALRCGKCSSFI